MVFCDNCKWLEYTEERQNEEYINSGWKPLHYCVLWEKRLYHRHYHPSIVPCSDCYRVPPPFPPKQNLFIRLFNWLRRIK